MEHAQCNKRKIYKDKTIKKDNKEFKKTIIEVIVQLFLLLSSQGDQIFIYLDAFEYQVEMHPG